MMRYAIRIRGGYIRYHRSPFTGVVAENISMFNSRYTRVYSRIFGVWLRINVTRIYRMCYIFDSLCP